jgi:Protein of unknown function (DUF3572)
MRKVISSDDDAEALALQALTFIMADSDMVQGFMALSGVSPDMFADLVTSRAFLVSVLEFLTSDDAQVLAFTQPLGLDPMRPLEALRQLQGLSHRNWT